MEAAAREVLEETGWRPGPLRHLITSEASNGLSDQRFLLYVADGASYVGEPSDPAESERVEWVTVERLRSLAQDGDVVDGLTLVAVLYWLTFQGPA